MGNPYESPSESDASNGNTSTVLFVSTLILTLLNGVCAAAGAGAIVMMLGWVAAARPVSIASLVISGAWILAPQVGALGVALALRKTLTGSLVAMPGIVANGVWGYAVYYDNWRHLFHPLVPGHRDPMNCFLPVEFFLPILQWLGVGTTASFAVVAACLAYLTCRCISRLRQYLKAR